ncbi:VOC family protein [Paenibacillus solisilvae]|uniref:VOC family protein n=1 Tax=Paenibacillus solisilvae TaxID=2486751 RepID=A0ABW0VYG2_9BACL
MITHFADLQLHTVSIQGVKQIYQQKLGFPVTYETDSEIRFQPAEHFTLSFVEVSEPLSPAHFAFEVPYSTFHESEAFLRESGIPILQWPDGREADEFETGKNLYFRDGDGNLLELIAHSYITENVLSPVGGAKIMYLREAGFPTDDVPRLREWFKQVLQLKTREESDSFNFVIGGTAHAIVTSSARRWIPIAMRAMPPRLTASFGVPDAGFIRQVRAHVAEQDIRLESAEELCWNQYGYGIRLVVTPGFDAQLPAVLQLPLSAPPGSAASDRSLI